MSQELIKSEQNIDNNLQGNYSQVAIISPVLSEKNKFSSVIFMMASARRVRLDRRLEGVFS